MSSLKHHLKKSMRYIEIIDEELYFRKWIMFMILFYKLHKWFDDFAGKGKYIKYYYIWHREKRHHVVGIKEAVEIFTEKYRNEFPELSEKTLRDIIYHEAWSHVWDDMGEIPTPDMFNASYWRQKRGF